MEIPPTHVMLNRIAMREGVRMLLGMVVKLDFHEAERLTANVQPATQNGPGDRDKPMLPEPGLVHILGWLK
jgi:hypothetical protein